MRLLGENGVPIPRAMGEAELSMRDARDALGSGQPGQALDPQTNALDQLRQGGQAMMQEMQQMLGQNPGPGQQGQQGQQFGQSPTDRDPLGRSMFNRGDADMFGPEVPDDLDLGRARSIMEELHRRASQRHRPDRRTRLPGTPPPPLLTPGASALTCLSFGLGVGVFHIRRTVTQCR